MTTELLPNKLVFVDVETTGLKAEDHRVIEIGLLRVENGQIIETYQQLINPERSIPWFIQRHTGITSRMVKNAPVFGDISQTVASLLDGCTFIAHNVGFDYSFISTEFRRIGIDFNPRRHCTAQLSRRLYPEYRRHGLDYIIDRFQFDCPSRHRALDDAKVLWQFYQTIQQQFSPQVIASFLQ